MKSKAPYEVVHNDPDFLAVNKPAGLAVLPGRGRSDNLLGLLNADPALRGGGDTPLHLVHRLDADTSGIMILAKNPEAQRSLSEQFRTRTVTKEYWALVRGTPTQESGSTDLPIGGDPKNKNRMIIRGTGGDGPKKSRTKWVVAERFAGVTLLKVFPITGRRHQIRVHLKAMGYPLAVDPYYGGETLLLSEFKRRFKLGKGQEERPLMSRLTLHARSISFAHPRTAEPLTLTAELPKDFRSTLDALRKWAVG